MHVCESNEDGTDREKERSSRKVDRYNPKRLSGARQVVNTDTQPSQLYHALLETACRCPGQDMRINWTKVWVFADQEQPEQRSGNVHCRGRMLGGCYPA